MTRFHQLLAALFVAVCVAGSFGSVLLAQELKDPVLQPGKFPPPNSGTYLAGELVLIDPVNRRGGLRVYGDNSQPLHYFAMLPYGAIWFHGAPAELRDLPIGTHVHGYFYQPPVGEEATVPPLPKDQAQFQLKHNHAVSLEDDFSFYQRRGQSWKVVSIDATKGKLNVTPHFAAEVTPTGPKFKDGINSSYTFDINEITKVWIGSKLVELTNIAPEQVVQVNLGWAQGWRDQEFTVTEIWLDDESRKFATEHQRRKHVKYQKQHWVPGWIDAVEDNDFGGGTVTLTLFGGLDPSLYAELKATRDKGFGVAVAEKTLRTWFHRSDKKIGQVIDWKETENPPPGSSGIQIRMKFTELLDGYRPGKCVRVKSDSWTFVTMPPEERMKSVEEQKRSAVFSLP
ncbi:MAG: hypothetical protein JWM11_2520 [Planctomycetaceae bacterium]|nr:hypothetical protein [Planctomycetaceae bacterium]